MDNSSDIAPSKEGKSTEMLIKKKKEWKMEKG